MIASFYSERRSWLHALPAGLKLLVLVLLGSALLLVQNLGLLLGLCAACALLFASLGSATRGVRRLLASLVIAALLVAVFHLLVGEALLGLGSLLRLLAAGLLGLAVTVSTSTGDLLNFLERLLQPMQRWGMRPERIGLRLALMLRFTEHFFLQWQRLDESHRLRTGKPGGWRLLAPLTLLMLVAARRVADTLQLRLGE